MIFGYAERIATKSPDCRQLRCSLALKTGRTNEFLKLQLPIFKSQEAQTDLTGSLNHNLRALKPHYHILVGIGSTVHLDPYVKAGVLGMRPPTRTEILHENWLLLYAVNQCMLDYWRPFIDIVEDEDQLRTLRPLKDIWLSTLQDRCGAEVQLLRGVILLQSLSSGSGIGSCENHCSNCPMNIGNVDWLPCRPWGCRKPHGSPHFMSERVNFGAHRHSEPFRDANINTYQAAIEAITERGGWAIRMGDSSMTPLPKVQNVIDYANDPIKSDWMHVFLSASARFIIGTSSGPSTISRAFGVPIAMTNHLQASTNYLGAHDIFLPRLLRRGANGTLVSFEQQMSLPFSACFSNGMYRNLCGFDVIPNTAVEIRELAEETMDSLGGTLKYSPEDQKLQHQFNTLTAECGTLLGLPGIGLQCRIGRDFLMRHQSLLPDNFENHDQPDLEL